MHGGEATLSRLTGAPMKSPAKQPTSVAQAYTQSCSRFWSHAHMHTGTHAHAHAHARGDHFTYF